MSQDLTYKKAFDELAMIVRAIESETISVDELAEKIKRASQLIDFCQTKLSGTEAEVKKILEQMETKISSDKK